MADPGFALTLPRASVAPGARHRWARVLVLGAYAYPVLCVASLYLTWFAAWAALGHAPRPGLDDPKYIGLLVDVPYAVTMGLLNGALGAMLLGVGLTPIAAASRAAKGRRRLVLGLVAPVLLVLLWGATLWFLMADPFDVVTWYAD